MFFREVSDAHSFHKETAKLTVSKTFGDEYTTVVNHIHKLDIRSLQQANEYITKRLTQADKNYFFTFDKDEAFDYPNPNTVQTKIYHAHDHNFVYLLPESDHLGQQRHTVEVFSDACYTAYVSLVAAYLAKNQSQDSQRPHDDFSPPQSGGKTADKIKRTLEKRAGVFAPKGTTRNAINHFSQELSQTLEKSNGHLQ